MSAAVTKDAVRSPSASDRDLLIRYVRRRDEHAFADLVRRHGAMVLGVCRRVLRSSHDVEDAFQATFLVLARDAHRIRKRQSLASWLHGVAYRTSLRAAESRHRRIRLLQDVTMIEDSSLADVQLRHERQVLDEELAALPEKYRAPLVLHYLEGKSNTDVAKELKLTVTTIEGRLKRGKKELRLRLTRRGIGLSAALAALHLSQSAASAAELNSLVGTTIQAGLSYSAGDPAGPLFTHEAAHLAGQELITMSTTTTATLTALVLLPLAAILSGHGELPSHAEARAPLVATVTEADPADTDAIAAANIPKDGPTRIIEQGLKDIELRRITFDVIDNAGELETQTTTFIGNHATILETLKKLEETTTLDTQDAPLKAVVEEYWSKLHGMPIRLDTTGLASVGVSGDTPITVNLSGVTLREALQQVLEPLNCGVIATADGLIVTSAEIARGRAPKIADRDESQSAPVENSAAAPAQAPSLDQVPAAFRSRDPDPRWTTIDYKTQNPNEQRIQRALQEQTSVEFVETPLGDTLEYFSKLHGIPILIDEWALKDEGITTDEPITLTLSGVSLQSALNIMLGRLQLVDLIQDEVMKVTTKTVADETMETRVYELRQLPNIEPETMAEIIESSIPDADWEPIDGTGGTISPIDGGLIIKQNQRTHRRIADLIHQLQLHAANPNHPEATDESTSGLYDRLRTDVLNTMFRAERLRDKDSTAAVALLETTIEKVRDAGLSVRQTATLVDALQKTRESILNPAGRLNGMDTVAPPALTDERISFNFRQAPWMEVLTLFADFAKLSLDAQSVPPGTFSYQDPKQYTVAEALDVLNGYLLRRDYALVRKDRFLVCVNLDDGLPSDLVPSVTVEELPQRGRNELLTVAFKLHGIRDANEIGQLAREIETLTSHFAKVTFWTHDPTLFVTDTGANLRRIRDVYRDIVTIPATDNDG